MEQIKLSKRTPEETEAYLQGFQAGLKANNDTLLVFKAVPYATKEEQKSMYDSLVSQVSNGVVLIGGTIDLIYAGPCNKIEFQEVHK